MTNHITHDVENEPHRAECAECQALWDELDAISAEAARLPLLTPSRDLWSGIEARISGAPTVLRPRVWQSQTFRLAMAASLLVAVSSAVTWQLASKTPADDAAAPAFALDDDADAESAFHLASLTESVGQMDVEIGALQRIVLERRGELDPATVQVLERNLALIDAAIADSRAALASDPSSQFLSAEFTRAYTSKLTLLREAATLPVGL
jgi:hypothetical protein